MYNVSNNFIAAMKDRPYIAKLILDGTDVIQGDAIQEITFRSGANGNENAFALGGAVSSSVEVIMNKDKIGCALHGREVKVELGIELGDAPEWIPMGIYYVTDPLADDDLLTVTAYDALAAKFEIEYEDLAGIAFGPDAGVSSTAFLQALGARRGVEVDVSNLTPIWLTASPAGFTERQIIGFIAALYGGFASIDREGVLRIRGYSKCDVSVTADNYYEGGMEKADYVFSVQWLKCYNEIYDMTMIVGDTTGEQGIYLESIWMTNTILNDLWNKLQSFSYRPVTELSFLGNPLIDAGDIISFEDVAGETIKVPVMNITHEYDGGIITRVTANGQSKTDSYASPLKRDIKRAGDNARKYADQLDEALNQLEVLKRLTADGADDAVYLQNGKLAIKATAILTGVLDAALVTVKNLLANSITSGVLKSKDGKTYFDLDTAEIVAANYSGSRIVIKNGLLTMEDPNQILRLELSKDSIHFFDSNGDRLFGLDASDDAAWFWAQDVASGEVVGKRVGWKTIKFVDAKGISHAETILATY